MSFRSLFTFILLTLPLHAAPSLYTATFDSQKIFVNYTPSPDKQLYLSAGVDVQDAFKLTPEFSAGMKRGPRSESIEARIVEGTPQVTFHLTF